MPQMHINKDFKALTVHFIFYGGYKPHITINSILLFNITYPYRVDEIRYIVLNNCFIVF